MPDASDRVAEAVLALARLLGEAEFVVIGSQAFYGTHSQARPSVVVESSDVDLLPPRRIDIADFVRAHSELGYESDFHLEKGFYVDVVQPETPPLPANWVLRASRVEIGFVTIRGENRPVYAVFPEIHDLTASKAVLGRDTDRLFLAAVVENGLVDRETLLARIAATRVRQEAHETAQRDVVAAFSLDHGHTSENA